MKKFDLDIILFTYGPGAYAPKRLVEEAKKRKVRLRVISYKDISIVYSTEGIELKLKDGKMPVPRVVFLRGLGEDSKYNPIRTAIATWFKSRGTKLLNEASLNKWPSLDKTTQHVNLAQANLPIAESFSFSSKDGLKKWSMDAFPFIAKDVIGSSGEEVFKISGGADLRKLLKAFNSDFKIKALLFQRFLPNATDLRVIVLGSKILGAMKRTAPPGQFLSNYSRGGMVEPYRIEEDSEARRLAIVVSKLFKLDYGGIDLMKNEEGRWVVLEINRACQFEGFEKSTAINVAGRIVEYLAK
jgi:RimK family alpha-L-glutamate ligase